MSVGETGIDSITYPLSYIHIIDVLLKKKKLLFSLTKKKSYGMQFERGLMRRKSNQDDFSSSYCFSSGLPSA